MTEEIKLYAEALKQGKVLLYPTDTIWGLGCDAASSEAVKKVINIKMRPDTKSLIVLVSDINMLGRYFKTIPDIVFDLEENSTKPITYVLDSPIGLAPEVVNEDNSLAVRIPKNEFCVQLLRRFGKAIVSTSANLHGQPAPQRFDQISPEILHQADVVADKKFDKNATGVPSSIIKIKPNGEFNFIRK